jgi:hypothetical protein
LVVVGVAVFSRLVVMGPQQPDCTLSLMNLSRSVSKFV